jgi:ComF family protein
MTLPAWLRAEPRGPLGVLMETFFPPHCVACGAAGAWLCPACIAAIPGPRRLVPVSRLRVRPDGLDGALALAPHVYPLREAVHGFKYGGLRVLADPLSALLAEGWQVRHPDVDVVIPVPLHRDKMRRRGYNQSELLSLAFGERVGLEVRSDIVKRWRATRSQIGLSPEERQENVSGAFICAEGPVRGARVALIDDVLTTGATMSACARALREAGASEVWGLALTHPPASVKEDQ